MDVIEGNGYEGQIRGIYASPMPYYSSTRESIVVCSFFGVKSEITRPLHLCSLVFFQLNPEIVHHEGSAISNAVNGGCQGCIR